MGLTRTERQYRTDVTAWEAWATEHGYPPFPAHPTHVAAWLDHTAAARSHATVRRRRSALAAEHRNRGLPDPTKDPVVTAAVRRSKDAGRRGTGPTRPLPAHIIRTALTAWAEDTRPIAARDAAALALGYAAAARPSEAVAVAVADLVTVDDGVAVLLGARTPAWVGLPDGPAARAVLRWAEMATGPGPLLRRVGSDGRTDGPALSVHALAVTCQRADELAGGGARRWSPGALRQGFLTDVAAARVPRWLVAMHARVGKRVSPDPETAVLHSPVRHLGL